MTSTDHAWFQEVTFTGDAWFQEVTFSSGSEFTRAAFTGDTYFGGATFSGGDFGYATFTGKAWFNATFTGVTLFSEVTFSGDASFNRSTFAGDVWFDSVTFARAADFGEVHVLDFDAPDRLVPRSWPPGPSARILRIHPTAGSCLRSLASRVDPAERPLGTRRRPGKELGVGEGYRKSEQGAGLIGRLRSSCRWWCDERGEWQGGGRSPAALGSPSEVMAGGPGKRQRADCT